MTDARDVARTSPDDADRQARDLPLDAHLHTELSHDSAVPIDVYAEQAVRRGIPEIAITDHLDFSPGWRSTSAPYAERERYVRDAAERWAGAGLAIRFGVEITYDPAWEPDIRDHLARCAYDYTIGSVHLDAGSPYLPGSVALWVAGRPLGAVLAPYVETVVAAARSGLFDTLGHLDYVKRWLHPHVTPAQLAAAPEWLEPVLLALVDSGIALEVNTSGLRQSPGETYPAPWAVARYRELGGERVVAGSDGHRPEWFAWGLADGYDAIRDAGFDVLSVRRGAGPVRVPLAPLPEIESASHLTDDADGRYR